MPEKIEIQVVNLCKSFNDNPVLNGVDLSIHEGDTVAIVGGSGCGKTVLMNLILGQLKPDEGEIYVIDHDKTDLPFCRLSEIDEFERDNLHKHWGVVFQRNALFSGTVYENIALWLKEVRNMEDESILPIARRSLEAVSLPSDDEFLYMDHDQLSGGMAKRLAVARALAMEPVVLFYDEPTTGLDPTSSAQIHDLIFATHNHILPAGMTRTTIIITHDKDLLNRLQPRTIMLHDGKIFFDGSFAGFKRSRSKIIRPYFDLMPVLQKRDSELGTHNFNPQTDNVER